MAFYSQIDASRKFRVGEKKKDYAGNEYIYAKGVAANVVGAWVSFGAAYLPTLAVADTQGMLGVSMAANTSTSAYSWYAVRGVISALCLVSFDGTNGAGVWLTSTAGSVDDADVAGDAVIGAIGLTDRDATAGTSSFQLNYPFCVDGAVD